MLLVHDLDASIAVVITCHNYEHLLPEALDSVLQQSTMPNEIIIVDDKPDQLYYGQSPITKCQQVLESYQLLNLKYVQTDFGDPLKAREAGFLASSSKYLCILDADDQLGKDYLRLGLERFANTHADVIYSDIEYFENQQRTTAFSEHLSLCNADICNFMHVGCLVTREAIQTADAFNHPPLDQYHEDWMFWRKILQAGYHVAKQTGLYRARKHDTNRSTTLERKFKKSPDTGHRAKYYYTVRGIQAATIAFTSQCDQSPEQLLVTKQDWPLDQIHLILYSQDRNISAPCDYSIMSSPDRINHAARIANTDYIFYYDESLEYQPDICKQLLLHMDTTVVGVHDTRYDIFKCTMIATQMMRENVYNGHDIKLRKMAYVNSDSTSQN